MGANAGSFLTPASDSLCPAPLPPFSTELAAQQKYAFLGLGPIIRDLPSIHPPPTVSLFVL